MCVFVMRCACDVDGDKLGRPFTVAHDQMDGRSVDVGLTEAILIEVAGRETIDEAFVLGNEVLIGQTVLEKLDLLADCANQRLVPNPDHPDQPVTKIKHS